MELERFGEQHLGAVAELIADPEVLHFTRIPEPAPPGFERVWLDAYEAHRRTGTREAFAIVEDGRFLGLALAPHIDREAGEVELGYLVASAARGRGVATEALRQLTRWAFDELGAQRIELMIESANAPSVRVAERCGYVREGERRSTYLKQGRRVDTLIYSKLPSDP
jgi:RimJ/RimL family protein N-acetyltransferase